MKKLIVEALKLIIEKNGSIGSGKSSILTEKQLLSLKPRPLIKLYDKVVKAESRKKFETIWSNLGGGVTDDDCRQYMIDKLFDIYYEFDVLYCPDIEDEIILDDSIFDECDERVIILYNHNLFDHDFKN